jgi:hypothetical protein
MRYLFLLSFLLNICLHSLSYGEIIIRLATQEDLIELLELDRRIAYEYFIPLIQKNYGHLLSETTIKESMERELTQHDPSLFSDAIEFKENLILYTAGDRDKNCLCGLVLFQRKDSSTIELLLHMADAAYRDQDVELNLLQAAINYFNEIKRVKSLPTQYNLLAHQLYEQLGFVNKGPGSQDIVCVFGFGLDEWVYDYELAI